MYIRNAFSTLQFNEIKYSNKIWLKSLFFLNHYMYKKNFNTLKQCKRTNSRLFNVIRNLHLSISVYLVPTNFTPFWKTQLSLIVSLVGFKLLSGCTPFWKTVPCLWVGVTDHLKKTVTVGAVLVLLSFLMLGQIVLQRLWKN